MDTILGLVLLVPASAIVVSPLYLAFSDLGEHILNPQKQSKRKTAHQITFPEYEYQLYREKEQKRRQQRQRFFRT